ncbi:hypothetical protein HUE56_29730 (plasmid) [Azospirillum oryzae]|uniref:Uncharacterized protein n=1 Tax=Azospirillum oryzae TaxID=286727 RepID=A0A6N1B0C4_9PROT|nr:MULTISPECIES: hypothetical protein [Azospirillum]KAA0584743.1 hypothetical protein FZ938_28535 [Azospirillum oryzae]QCG99227.1 hypothetical protein E6C67_36175 [Azospirillum sp. TSA2s]QKS54684.1 hypothetical protein HUE56_29730 [Azospirillum oryzae]GLR77574.1 hypothetical protein GCM10007856_02420 [Azospirillum oryzae]
MSNLYGDELTTSLYDDRTRARPERNSSCMEKNEQRTPFLSALDPKAVEYARDLLQAENEHARLSVFDAGRDYMD